jgi:hypothetical protein
MRNDRRSTYVSKDSPGGKCTTTSPPSLARTIVLLDEKASGISDINKTCLPMKWDRYFELTRGWVSIQRERGAGGSKIQIGSCC